MTKQVINVGTSANDRKGDSLRAAFQKTNANFTELYDRAVNTDAQTLTLIGDTLAISGGNTVDLSKYVDTSFSGNYDDLINKPTIPDVSNFITAEDIPTDLIGSVFADDSTLLVDGVNGVITGTLTGAWNSPGNIFSVTGEGIQLSTTLTALSVTSSGLVFSNVEGDTAVNLALSSGNTALSSTGSIAVSSQGPFSASTGSLVWAIDGTATLASAGLVWSINGPAAFASNDLSWAIAGSVNLAANNIIIGPGGIIANLQGSVFADDSTLLMDGVNGVIPAGVISGKLDYDTVPIEYLRFPEPDVLVITPTPSSSGTKGEVIYSAGFVYICVATNTWVRVAAETAWE